MNRFPLALFAAVLLLSACAPRVLVKNRPGQKNPRVAVVPFKDAPGAPGTGELAREAFATEILAVQSYEVIDRSALDKVLEEQKLGLSGAIDPEKAVELGKLLGADGVVIGAVTEYTQRNFLMFPPAKVSLTARMIDTKTGVVFWSAQHSVGGLKRWLTLPVWPIALVASTLSPSAEDQVQKAARSVCRNLQKQLTASH